jgi:hypothetical protein
VENFEQENHHYGIKGGMDAENERGKEKENSH